MEMGTILAFTDRQRAIIGAVLAKPAIRRSEVAQQLGISAQTIMRAVLPLVEMGALQETLLTTGGRGKPASSLKFASGSLVTLGISLASDRVRVQYCDLAGKALVSLTTQRSYESAAVQVAELDRLLNESQKLISQSATLVGVGVSVQGYLLDKGVRFMARSDPIGWARFDLQAHLFERYCVPVKLMNDGKTLASSLILDSPYQNFFCLHLSSGIGGGIVSGGQLLMGANGNAGEVGNLFSHSPDRPLDSAFLKAANIETWADWPGLSELPAKDHHTLCRFLEQAGALISNALEQSLAILDFEAVYLCSRMPEDLLKALCEHVDIPPLGTNLVGNISELRNPAPTLHPFHVQQFARLACVMALDNFLTPSNTATV